MTLGTNTASPWLMAEIGVNHDGDIERARDMVREAAAAGFDAVKFQYWIVDELLAPRAPNAAYQGDGDQHDLLARLRLEVDQLAELRDVARDAGIAFVCTPDGERACADVLTLDPPVLKIGSGDADNPWLLHAAAQSGRPLLVSTGMMTDAEVKEVGRHLASCRDVVFLHCVSAYPTPLREANLARMARLRELTGRPVGFSDHTLGVAATAAAVALGAGVVEKHVTWDVDAPGPDHAASLALRDAPEWVATVRAVAAAVHDPVASAAEAANRDVVRKGLYPKRSLDAGYRLRREDLEPLRPLDGGVPALAVDRLVGWQLRVAVGPERPLHWDDLAP
ncbi:MAG TPA: N-acetylneuraminate synthase family protein [Acidimicrobiia bacterium]|nr:N-acetylneuraminate synthase family protein [Acidimicrobiia bacterium]